MKVLQICNDFYGTKLYKHLFETLRKRNIENVVFVPAEKDSAIEMQEKNVYLCKCFKSWERYFFYHKERTIFEALKESVLLQNTINLSHAHTVFTNGFLAYKLYEIYQIPYIVTVRNTDINLFFKYRWNLRHIGVTILQKAKYITFLSPKYRDACLESYIPTRMYKEFKQKSIIIPNGIDDFWHINSPSIEKKRQDKRMNLIYAGDINKNKNIVTTIQACKKLRYLGYDIVLIVAGKLKDPKYAACLEEPFVEYHGFCTQQKLMELYRKADIFVLPSHKETFGLVYAEALSQGLPVIYTKNQGFDGQFAEGEVGYHVVYNDADQIVETIKKIYENYDQLRQNAIKKSEKFKWDRISGVYEELYNKVKV